MLVTEQFQFLLSFIEMFDHTMEINGNRNRLVTNIIQNIFFYVVHHHTGPNNMRVSKR